MIQFCCDRCARVLQRDETCSCKPQKRDKATVKRSPRPTLGPRPKK